MLVPINEKEIITDKTDCEPDLAVDNEQNNITNPTDGNLIDGNLTDGKTDITTEEGTENPPAGEEVKILILPLKHPMNRMQVRLRETLIRVMLIVLPI